MINKIKLVGKEKMLYDVWMLSISSSLKIDMYLHINMLAHKREWRANFANARKPRTWCTKHREWRANFVDGAQNIVNGAQTLWMARKLCGWRANIVNGAQTL